MQIKIDINVKHDDTVVLNLVAQGHSMNVTCNKGEACKLLIDIATKHEVVK